MLNPDRCPIIILGVERSGTSVVAEMLHKWGAYAGPPEKLHSADMHAPRGYWEYEPLWDLLAELGDFDTGATWWDPDFQHRMRKKAATPVYRKKATELMAEMHNGGPWFWKDPALSHFLPFWKQIWDDAIYIITVRNPLDTAVSWQKFIMPPNVKGTISFVAMNLLRWQHIMTLILQHTEDAQHRLFLGYEDIVRNPYSQTERLAAFLNAKFEKRVSLDSERWLMRLNLNYGEMIVVFRLNRRLKQQTNRKHSILLSDRKLTIHLNLLTSQNIHYHPATLSF